MLFRTILLVAFFSLAAVFRQASYGAEPPKQTKAGSANAGRAEKQAVHITVRSQSEIRQTFAYFPHPAIPDELQGYAGTQVSGTGAYRMIVDPQGAVSQVSIVKGFTVTAVYDERFSDIKGNAVPALDQVMVQALQRWRAKPGPMRVVDIYWSFGTQRSVNYGKGNASK